MARTYQQISVDGVVRQVARLEDGGATTFGVPVVGMTPGELRDVESTAEYQEYLAAGGTIVSLPPIPSPLVYSRLRPVSERRRTADATPAEIWRATLAPMTGYRALLMLLGVDVANGNLRQITASVVAKRLANGAVLVGTPVVIANHQDAGASTWAIAAFVTGNDIVITVAGAAGRPIDWSLAGDIFSFTPGGA